MSKGKNVLVAGATGTTGKIIVDLLKNSTEYEPIATVCKEEQQKEEQLIRKNVDFPFTQEVSLAGSTGHPRA